MIESILNFVVISPSMYNIKESVRKIIFNFVVKPRFDNIHGWKHLFCSCGRNKKSKHKYNDSIKKLVDNWYFGAYQPLAKIWNI
jgi:hypothetical protein